MTLSQLKPYLAIARFDHWFKNVFMLPGVLFALALEHITPDGTLLVRLAVALLAAGLVASSNYVINEIVDADQDRLHPVKCRRPVPSGQIVVAIAYVEWLAFTAAGLALAWAIGWWFFWSALALWLMGCVYNIAPLRTKEKPYLDVLSESVNNPLRLLLGWHAVATLYQPPLSLVLAYWMIGAFFMAVKRFAEYRMIAEPTTAASYRSSFGYYDEPRLLISIMYYVAAFGLFFGIFLIRYHMEFILSIPLIAGFIAWYMRLGFGPDSPVQYPEKLYREHGFMAYTMLCVVVMVGLLFVRLPWLRELLTRTPILN